MNQEIENTHKIVLLLEDNKAEIRLFQEALKSSLLTHQLMPITDGISALAYLNQEGKYANTPLPDLILLDLNLPKKNGLEVLAEIKSDPKLKRIPVVILTSSKNEDDISQVYNLHGNCYITKPHNLSDLFQVINAIDKFWLSTVTLPLK